ncbi:MAG: ABC transporter substrate-binding protein [Opitutales bacterium]|jgi:iron complex transport system substrate-binding protein
MKIIHKTSLLFTLGLAIFLLGPARACAEEVKAELACRTITDMAGRTVRIPANVTKVLSVSPPPTTFVYMLAPEKLAGWLGAQPKENMAYIPKEYHDKPVFNWGRGNVNVEAYIVAAPDLVFVGSESCVDPLDIAIQQEKFGSIPLVCVDNTRNATEYSATLRFMGEVLGVPDRAEKLIAYYEGVLKEVQIKVEAIPAEKRVRVYYAEGNSGRSTDPSGSVHSQLIDVCGGINVASCTIDTGSGMTQVTLESILTWQPQVIITTDANFAKQAPEDETWQKLPAVANHRIYVTPSQPFNWFDRPPGVNRIVGIPWTAHILYPEVFPADWCRSKIREFYELFYHYTLTDEELDGLLNK